MDSDMIVSRALGRKDALLAGLLGVMSVAVTWVGAWRLCREGDAFYLSHDLWFESDMYRRFLSMTFRSTTLTVNNKHPLFALLTYPPTRLLLVAHVSDLHAVQAVLALAAGGWLAAFFCLLRKLECRPFDAVIFTVLVKVSAAELFWGPVPETFSFGSFAIIGTLLLVAVDDPHRLKSFWYVAANILTLGFSTTNWMAGILVTVARWPWFRAASIALVSLGLFVGLWGAQKAIFPHVPPLVGDFEANRQFVLDPVAGGPLVRIRALAVHALVMPKIERTSRPSDHHTVLSVNYSSAGSGTAMGRPSVAIWLVLLALGTWASWRLGGARRLVRVIWLLIAGQIGLHLIYGDEMFLYSLHVFPLLVLIAALTTHTRYRRTCLILATILIVLVSANNIIQFDRAAATAEQELRVGQDR